MIATLTHPQKERIREIFDAVMREIQITTDEVDRILSIPYSVSPIEQIHDDTWVRIGKILRITENLTVLLGGISHIGRWLRSANKYLQ
jgi:hypothetical protein